MLMNKRRGAPLSPQLMPRGARTTRQSFTRIPDNQLSPGALQFLQALRKGATHPVETP